MMEQLSVNLALDIIYVHGTVNGLEAEFSLTAPGTWTAVAPRADDGRYEVSITAYNSLGTPSTYNTIIHKLDEMLPPKTDWTAADYYNADDLNRVEANTAYVADELGLIGYPVMLEAVRSGRDMTSIEFADSLSRVERNIEALQRDFMPLPGFEESNAWAPGKRFDYNDANRLERNLELLHTWLLRLVAGLEYCGTFYCGEGGELH